MNKELAEKNIVLKRNDVWKKIYFSSSQKSYTLKEIEKIVRALEIIKEKRVDIGTLFICFEKYDLETFNMSVNGAKDEISLTQEEYDLLKEVLK
jgi:hypothetical protein